MHFDVKAPVIDPARIWELLHKHPFFLLHVSMDTYEGVVDHILNVGKSIRGVFSVDDGSAARSRTPVSVCGSAQIVAKKKSNENKTKC